MNTPDTEMMKLADCPFCGSSETYRHEADEDIIGAVAIGCSDCGALGPFHDIDDFGSKPEAFTAAEESWNERRAKSRISGDGL